MAKINKRELIMNAMLSLMTRGDAGNATVSDIAREAGIAKGSIYYYFKSKDEILDAVLERSYSEAIENCWQIAYSEDMNSLQKMKRLFLVFVSPSITSAQNQMINYLHLQDDIVVHHKFLVLTIKKFTPILTELLIQQQEEGLIHTQYPQQVAEIILTSLTFLLDHTLFPSSDEEMLNRLHALSILLQNSTSAPEGSLSFLYDPELILPVRYGINPYSTPIKAENLSP